MALAPLRQFGLKTTMITTLQAISGAGYPGVPSWDILGNVIPHIGGGEEEKIETETNKILGTLGDGTVDVSSGDAQRDDDARAGAERPHRIDFGRPRAEADRRSDHRRLAVVPRPAAGARPAVGAAAADRLPRPKRTGRSRCSTSNRDGGMTVTVGRLRPCPLFDYKFVALGHNTIRGAAGAAILNAELMHREGLL